MRIIPLGCSAGYPGKGEASTSLLLRANGVNLVIDFGTGILANLQKWIQPYEIGSIIITHLHGDHFLDLWPLYTCLAFSEKQVRGVDIFLPPGGKELFANTLFLDARQKFLEIFSVHEIGEHIKIAPFNIRAVELFHSIPSYGLRVEAENSVIVYSSDTRYHQKLIELAKGADLFFCEATLQKEHADFAAEVGHLTAAQAGEVAKKAQVKKLIIVHIWPTYSKEKTLKEASEKFGGEIILAQEGDIYEV